MEYFTNSGDPTSWSISHYSMDGSNSYSPEQKYSADSHSVNESWAQNLTIPNGEERVGLGFPPSDSYQSHPPSSTQVGSNIPQVHEPNNQDFPSNPLDFTHYKLDETEPLFQHNAYNTQQSSYRNDHRTFYEDTFQTNMSSSYSYGKHLRTTSNFNEQASPSSGDLLGQNMITRFPYNSQQDSTQMTTDRMMMKHPSLGYYVPCKDYLEERNYQITATRSSLAARSLTTSNVIINRNPNIKSGLIPSGSYTAYRTLNEPEGVKRMVPEYQMKKYSERNLSRSIVSPLRRKVRAEPMVHTRRTPCLPNTPKSPTMWTVLRRPKIESPGSSLEQRPTKGLTPTKAETPTKVVMKKSDADPGVVTVVRSTVEVKNESVDAAVRVASSPMRKMLQYACAVCDERVATKNSSITHLKGHRVPFCLHCLTVWRSKEQLDAHVRKAHGAETRVMMVTSKYGRRRQVLSTVALGKRKCSRRARVGVN
uniref:C2H2-type domain-containing protein n=1 Tax=Timema cristinae TaxID=61476 RepID=A0A7R9CN69_TIMCR|nr:unnamed protein product [Timema cristinae]